MAITLSKESKNKITLSKEDKNADMTWDEADMTWDEQEGTWSQPQLFLSKESKNTKLNLSKESK